MNQKKFIKALGTATVLAAFGFVACGDDSSSNPVVPEDPTSSETTLTSSETTPSSDSKTKSSESKGSPTSSSSKPTSSNDVDGSSSSVKVQCNALSPECGYSLEELCTMGMTQYCTGSSSSMTIVSSSSFKAQCDAFMPECGYSLEELCAMGYAQYCTGSSSSMVNPESSSAVNSSSSQSKEQCVPMPHVDPGAGISYQIPICSQEEEGSTQPDCKTDDMYVCLEGRWTNIQTETCRHITDVGDRMKPHPCDTEFEVAMDCAKNYYMMCAGGIWLNATGCDTTKEKCGFDDYKLCNDYNLRDYCNDDWLDEPCQDGKSRSARKYDNENSTSYSYIDYICVDGKWVDRMDYYCAEGRGCGSGGFQQCYESDIIGTACDEKDRENSWISKDGCDFQCRDGKYEFIAPPTGAK